MEHEPSPLSHAARFSFFGVGFLIFSWFSYFLAVGGFFARPLIIVFSILLSIGILAAARKWLTHEPWLVRIIAAITLVSSVLTVLHAEPTVFSGRDQGSISEAAIELAHNGRLAFSYPASDIFFDIYGPGKALNFPGFHYSETGKLITQFPLGYVSFLGAFDSMFGIDGFRIANGILFFLSAISIFFLVRVFAGNTYAGFAWVLTSTSFLPLWFSKFTLTENLALFLFSFLSLNLVMFLRENRAVFFLGSFLSALLLSVTRIEGLWMLGVALGVLFLTKQGRSFFTPLPKPVRLTVILFVGITLAINAAANLPYYKTIGKALVKNTAELPDNATLLLSGNVPVLASLWELFFAYGLAPIFLLGLAGIGFLIWKRSSAALIPALLALPTLWFLGDPTITPEHPWMLRRYLFSVWPALLFSGIVAAAFLLARKRTSSGEDLFTESGRRKWIAFLLFLALWGGGVTAADRGTALSENHGLLDQLKPLGERIGQNDLLLIDRETTGDPYAIPAGPLRFLFGKNAAYFFNPDDFTKIPQDRFNHIYLLAPLKNLEFWDDLPTEMFFIDAIPFSTEKLETLPLSDPRLPERTFIEEDAVLFELKKL